MLDHIGEILQLFARILTILPLLLFVTIFMGKRAIGELPVFDFIIILVLGAVVGSDIADTNIQHFQTVMALIFIAIFQRVVSNWRISNRKISKLITLEPTVVIQNGKFIYKNLRQIRFTIDSILQMLRGKDVFDINEVETAIIEPNGTLSVLKKYEKNAVTREDLSVVKKTSIISYPVIIEGVVHSDALTNFNLDEKWLRHELTINGFTDIQDIFFASIDSSHKLHVSLRNEYTLNIPPIKH